MSEKEINDYSEIQVDVLREIGNIGAGNATTALSTLLNAKISMKVPQVKFVEIEHMSDLIGNEEDEVVACMVTLYGEVKGMMMFIMKYEVTRKLVDMLMQTESDSLADFNDIEMSAVREIGNIITGAYLSSLSDLTHLKISESVPSIQIDMIGAVLSVPAIEFGKMGDKILLIETEFDQGIAINGYYVLVPDLESYKKILKTLGVE